MVARFTAVSLDESGRPPFARLWAPARPGGIDRGPGAPGYEELRVRVQRRLAEELTFWAEESLRRAGR